MDFHKGRANRFRSGWATRLRNVELAQTFRGSKYASIKLEEDTVLYRAGVKGTPLGQFYSSDKPVGVLQTRIDKAIPYEWPGGQKAPLDTGYAIKIPKDTTIHVGQVANQGGIFMGGTRQIVVEEPWNIPGVEVIEEWPLK